MDIDGRGRIARRYTSLRDAYVDDLGGDGRVSAMEREMANRMAGISVMADVVESWLADGRDVDVSEYARLVNAQTSLFRALGLKQRGAEDAPTLEAYLRATSAGAEPAA